MSRRFDPGVAASAASALRAWLIDGPAQQASGPEAGAVAGIVDESGRARYVYGEITGYYLHWLATQPGDERVRRAAAAAQSWVERRYGGAELPPTRIYLAAAPDDWRNRTQFCFDLAMLAGGLARAQQAGLVSPSPGLWRRLDDALIRFADSGLKAIDALRVHASSLPQRWSTEGGPFLAKAASRILLANEFARFGPKLVASARATLAEVRAAAPSAPLAMLHPTLYALEGVMTDAEAPLEPVAERLARILALASSTGELPEAPGSAVARSDVIAQALRVAILLRANAVAGSPADAALDRLAGALSRRVRPDGAIAFRPDAAPPELNSWCAMFAEQALRWYVHWRQTGAFAGVLAIDVV